MPATHLLHICAGNVVLYRWRAGVITEEARFQQSEADLARFGTRLATLRSGVVHVMLDLVEVGFHVDTIPFVRGADRKALLQRRLAQRFRDTTLSTFISLGYEKTQRREERVLLTAFTGVAACQPWLDALQRAELPVSGVYTPGLLAADLVRRLRMEKPRMVVVGAHRSGVRQIFVENRRLRFSRLNPLSAEDQGTPTARAGALMRETARLYEYLRGTQELGKDDSTLDALIIAPRGEAQHLRDLNATHSPELRIAVIDGLEAARRIGLKDAPHDMGVEALYLHVLARRRPAQQYASALARANYGIRSWQVGLVAGGGLFCAGCLLFAAVQSMQAYRLQEQAEDDTQQAMRADAHHDTITAAFPPLPTTLPNLRAVLTRHDRLIAADRTPRAMMVALSRAFDRMPQARLDRLDWKIQPAADGTPQETAELTVSLPDVASDELRTINQQADSLTQFLHEQPGLEVAGTQLPFDLASLKTAPGTGDADAHRAPLIRITVTRKSGA